MIPCKDCLVLGVCKNKIRICCDLLYRYMEENTSYSDEPDGKLIHDGKGPKAWREVESFFEKSYGVVVIRQEKGRHGSQTYTIEPKSLSDEIKERGNR